MKILKNKNTGVFGIKYKFFTILKTKRTNKYLYYLNALGSKKIGDCMFYRSEKKIILLNKYTLSLFGVLFTVFNYTLKYPILIIITPFFMYFKGARNYITDSVWVNHVRFFNNVNIVIIIILALLLVAF